MTQETDNLVLELLRAIRGDIAKAQGRLDDLTERLGSIEEQTSLLRRDMVRIDHRLDNFDKRLERIEKRLDLVDA